MIRQFPLNAAKIRLEWPIEQGGFGITAHTDSTGRPIIGLYSLNPEGQPTGQETEYAYDHLMLRVVAGYDEQQRAIIVFADIIVTLDGLAVRIVMPTAMIERGYDRYLFKAWTKGGQ